MTKWPNNAWDWVQVGLAVALFILTYLLPAQRLYKAVALDVGLLLLCGIAFRLIHLTTPYPKPATVKGRRRREALDKFRRESRQKRWALQAAVVVLAFVAMPGIHRALNVWPFYRPDTSLAVSALVQGGSEKYIPNVTISGVKFKPGDVDLRIIIQNRGGTTITNLNLVLSTRPTFFVTRVGQLTELPGVTHGPASGLRPSHFEIHRLKDGAVMPGGDPRSGLSVDADEVRIQAPSLPPATPLRFVVAAQPVRSKEHASSEQEGEPSRPTVIKVKGTYDIDGESQSVDLSVQVAQPGVEKK